MTAETIFEAIASRFDDRAHDICVFNESGADFQPWCLWESFAACRDKGWATWPLASYAKIGMLGSRDTADLLIGQDGGGQIVVELGLIHAWRTNRWIASIDEDTKLLTRALSTPAVPLQVVLTIAPEPIEHNELWTSWLDMTTIWSNPTDLTHELPLGGSKQGVLKGWILEP